MVLSTTFQPGNSRSTAITSASASRASNHSLALGRTSQPGASATAEGAFRRTLNPLLGTALLSLLAPDVLPDQPLTLVLTLPNWGGVWQRNGQPVVAMHPAEGQGVTLSFDSVLLHSLCRLLQSAVKKSDWDMELKLPGTEAQESAGERPVRTLN